MPRIPPWLFRRARHCSPHVATLLPACRDIPSALNELRWIRDHVREAYSRLHEHHVAKLCGRRGRGEPLQYVLGTQPFGQLEIKCHRDVLIPRSETEAYTSHLAQLLISDRLGLTKPGEETGQLNIIDFCTGTGCIPLLLYAMLCSTFAKLTVRGVDISPSAVALANANIEHNVDAGNLPRSNSSQSLSIVQNDVFDAAAVADLAKLRWDVLVSNPPYVSKDVWNHGRGQLGYSVRKFEPQLALVPAEHFVPPRGVRHEDVFYAQLLDVGALLGAKVLLLEIGDQHQALRVASLCRSHPLSQNGRVELWRDWPDLEPAADEPRTLPVTDQYGQVVSLPVKGSGNLRAVLIQTRSRN
ncbi:hypothetical protein NLU13_9324 [Sarocladium strictum]|uniref:Uncharacterized protein n=1 Tax=Sarocladium strictum TaxID=5046 RepID=A0AA39GC50_SARSR|nr:hypothetical protein NLU13_9324 [Sarocladium strictum]